MSEEVKVDAVEATEAEPVLYAGKFKTVEELTKGYNEGLSVHLKNKELEAKLQKFMAVPSKYDLPPDIQLDDESLNRINMLSKTAQLTQEQYNTLALKSYNENLERNNKMAERRQAIGEEKLNLLDTYVNESLNGVNDSIKKDILSKVIQDDATVNTMLENRKRKLDSTVPGVGSFSASKTIDFDTEMKKVALQVANNPRSAELRNKYINLCNQAAANKAKK